MNILIIEDEPHAAQRLEKLVLAIEPAVIVLDRIDSVKRSVEWLLANKHPDLIFMDIHLADGICFSIFEHCEVKVPVIFTTAYDAYALKAFKVNSIDYILKPVDKDELESAFKKLRNSKAEVNANLLLDNISQAMSMLTKKFKTRFVIKIGEHLKTVEIEQVLYFYSQEKTTFCHIGEGRNLMLDYTLEQLEEMVDPGLFFRINRKYMVTAPSILDIISHTNSRLKLLLKGCNDNDIIVARERVQQFKDWLDR